MSPTPLAGHKLPKLHTRQIMILGNLTAGFYYSLPVAVKAGLFIPACGNRLCVRNFLSRFAELISLRAAEHMTRLRRMLRGQIFSFLCRRANSSGCGKCVFVTLMWAALACIDAISYLRCAVAHDSSILQSLFFYVLSRCIRWLWDWTGTSRL